MKLVSFLYPAGKAKLFVNPDHVIAIEHVSNTVSKIFLDCEDRKSVSVQGSEIEVASRLQDPHSK